MALALDLDIVGFPLNEVAFKNLLTHFALYVRSINTASPYASCALSAA